MLSELGKLIRGSETGHTRNVWRYLSVAETSRKPLKKRMLDALNPARQGGMGYTEYLITCLGILFLLFAPLPGGHGESVVDLVLQAIREFGQNSSLLLSLP